jgi:hypothetical protein
MSINSRSEKEEIEKSGVRNRTFSQATKFSSLDNFRLPKSANRVFVFICNNHHSEILQYQHTS